MTNYVEVSKEFLAHFELHNLLHEASAVVTVQEHATIYDWTIEDTPVRAVRSHLNTITQYYVGDINS